MKRYKYLLSLFLIFYLISCEKKLNISYQNADIIYQGEGIINSPKHKIVFMDSNSLQKQVIDPKWEFEKPVWSTDGEIIFGLSGGSGSYMGYPAYWNLQRDDMKVCTKNLSISLQIQGYGDPENPYIVVIADAWTINIFDISKCRQLQNLINYSDRPGKYEIAGFSYSKENNELTFGLISDPYHNPTYKLMLYNLTNDDEKVIGEGIYPSWSPDGSKIAFIGLDGLYVINYSDNGQIQKILDRQFFDPYKGDEWSFTTTPSWSPDSASLIYHRCDSTDICNWTNSKIYKINIYAEKEEILAQGGEYPNWKP